jgi:hypothetical protein
MTSVVWMRRIEALEARVQELEDTQRIVDEIESMSGVTGEMLGSGPQIPPAFSPAAFTDELVTDEHLAEAEAPPTVKPVPPALIAVPQGLTGEPVEGTAPAAVVIPVGAWTVAPRPPGKFVLKDPEGNTVMMVPPDEEHPKGLPFPDRASADEALAFMTQ